MASSKCVRVQNKFDYKKLNEGEYLSQTFFSKSVTNTSLSK